MSMDRLINTSKERGIDEAKINSPEVEDEEELSGVKELPTMAEEKTIETPKELVESVKEFNVDEMSEKEIETKYLEVLGKIEKQEKLSEKELNFKKVVDAAVAKAEEKSAMEYQRKLLEEKEIELSKKEEFLKEYAKTKQDSPDKVIQAREQDISLTGGSSITKAFLFFLQMRKAKKKGGKVLVQVFKNKRVLIKWTNKDISYVEFFTTDENKNELVEVTRFNEFIYSYEGSPIPVLFAVQGVAEGYNFFQDFQKNITAEMVSRLTSRAYHAGYEKGAELKNPNVKHGLLEGLAKFMPLIMIVGFLVMGYFLYQMYGNMAAVFKMTQAMQQQLAAVAPVIDTNALVYR